jgi:putative DNA primase/helicase
MAKEIAGSPMFSPTEQFRHVMQAAGLTPPSSIIPDGKLHRFASNGKRNDDAGWYVLHLDGIAAGCFGDWRGGFSQTWRADIGRALTAEEEDQQRAKVEAIRREREAEEARRKTEAREKANLIWTEAVPCASHPYLTRKQIQAHGARLYKDALVIPMRSGGELHSLQFIHADGSKKFLTGGRITGCYFSIGNLKDAPALAICEGFATGVTIHEATGYPVAVAFNAANLEAVARYMREKFPDLPLIICADDDFATEGNPGLTKGTEAARAVGGFLAIPDFGISRPNGATDFNDMAILHGKEAVKRAIVGVAASVTEQGDGDEQGGDEQKATADFQSLNLSSASSDTEVSQVAEVQANGGALCVVTSSNSAEVTQVADGSASPIPDIADRPAFRVFDEWVEHGGEKLLPGVWHFGTDKDGNPIQTWICSPLYVEAVTYDGQDNNFGRMLRFKNTIGGWREWAMPMQMLAGMGDELRGELLSMGVEIDPSPNARRLLSTYLQATPPKRRIRCALQVGWCEDSFVLPDTVIGPKASGLIFQSGERVHDEYTTGGTLAGWQSEIAARAEGNPLLTLALSAGFSGPLLTKCNAESGGLHFVGDSSTGKTTLLEAACSVWGGANYRRSWRATANGMEGTAALLNDCLLALDEISECNPNEVGAIVYALGNGRGKQRASRSGNPRPLNRWHCMVLSSGERTIETTMQEGGNRAKAGQAVRLLDLQVARAFGAWDNLHDLPSGTAFSDAIKRAAATHYGHAGRAFLEKLTRDDRDFCALLERIKGLQEFSVKGSEGQEKRAAARFALIALAGELATEYGITGWSPGDAIQAAALGFKVWRASRGKGNGERIQVLERLRDFIDRHGDSRFSDKDAKSDIAVRDRAGWWQDNPDGRIYLFTGAGLREALKGFDYDRAQDLLAEVGVLPQRDAQGRHSRSSRVNGKPTRWYPIDLSKLGDDYGTA